MNNFSTVSKDVKKQPWNTDNPEESCDVYFLENKFILRPNLLEVWKIFRTISIITIKEHIKICRQKAIHTKECVWIIESTIIVARCLLYICKQ